MAKETILILFKSWQILPLSEEILLVIENWFTVHVSCNYLERLVQGCTSMLKLLHNCQEPLDTYKCWLNCDIIIISSYISVELNVLFSKESTETCLFQHIFIRVDMKDTLIETIACEWEHKLYLVKVYIFGKHNHSICKSLIFLLDIHNYKVFLMERVRLYLLPFCFTGVE